MVKIYSNLPSLGHEEFFQFPNPLIGKFFDGLVAIGGNLSPGILLSAYKQGIFPWYSGGPIRWYSPDPRCVFKLPQFHLPTSMKKLLRKNFFQMTCDTEFDKVIKHCANFHKAIHLETWINDNMIAAYIHLHHLGFAHSIEVWQNDQLVGGLYGVSLGKMFFGESMFHLVPNASKAAFYGLIEICLERGIDVIDSQVKNHHTEFLGGIDITQEEYLQLLADRVNAPASNLPWKQKINSSLSSVFGVVQNV